MEVIIMCRLQGTRPAAAKNPAIRPLTFFPTLTRIGLWMMLQAWLPVLTQPKRFGCHHRLAVSRLPTCTDTINIEEMERSHLGRRYMHRADTLNPCYQFPSIAIQSYRRKEHDHESNGQRPQH